MRPLVPTLAILGCLIVATTGCQSTPEPAPAPGPVAVQPAKAAAAPREPGISEAAAAARETLAAAEELARSGDWVGATALFSVLPDDDLPRVDRARYGLLGAQLAIRSGDLETARRLLTGLDLRALPDPADAHLADAWLLAASGEPARAAGRLMRAEVAPAARQRINDTIWELATLTPAFDAAPLSELGSDVERGWWTLRRELLASTSIPDQSARIRSWQAARPDHPGAQALPQALRPPADYARPARVALLVPTSGPLARAGRAVRDGFLAAWFEQPAGQRFEIDLYDTGQGSLEDIHARVVAKGTDVIVGPLQRDAVAALNNLGSDIPVLALNYLPAGDPNPTLVQFGLAIEDDVATLVQWLRQEGLARVMILHGPHDWAARVQRALADQGLPAVASHLLPEMRTVPDAVGRAMHIEDSRARHAEVQRLMGMPLAFTPRSRTDVDALLALVDSVEITALVPALRFHYAQRIPAFATAQTLAGAGSGTLRAMDGYRVVDLPWQVPGDPGRRKLANAFQLDGNPFASMYALGADAFRLVDRVDPANRGAFTQLMGHTGVLTLLPDGRIRRELARLQVRGGQISLAGAR